MTKRGTWRVYGRLAGEFLPSKVEKIGPVSFGPRPAGINLIEPPSAPSGLMNQPVHMSTECAWTSLTSPCYFWLDVEASTPSDALAVAKISHMPGVLAALSIRGLPQPYRYMFLCTERPDGRVESAPSRAIKLMGWDGRLLSAEQTAQAEEDWNYLTSPDAARATFLFAQAVELTDRSDTTAEKGSALLAFFKIIEGMTQLVPIPPAPDLERLQKKYIAQLKSELDKNGDDLRAAISSIRKASDELRRVESDFLDKKIASMAKVLDLPNTWVVVAQNLNHFRNRRLGHAAPPPPVEELDAWLELKTDSSAWALSRSLLKAYVDWRAKISAA
jgi:hypothetical protein